MTETAYTTNFSQHSDIAVKINTPKDIKQRKPPVVVINNGFMGTMDDSHVSGLAGAVCGSNMTAVRFDPPGIGKSSGAPEQDYRYGNSLRALGIVIQSILNMPEFADARIGIWGYSMGADQAIQHAAEYPYIQALCLVAPAFDGISSVQVKQGIPSDFYAEAYNEAYRPSRHIAAVTAALLFIAGDADTTLPPEENAQRLLKEAKGSKHLIVIPGMSHFYWKTEHHRKRVYSHSTQFLKQRLAY